MIEFVPFPKLSRLTRNCIITEKLDGTNAQVIITEDGEIAAGSRTRIITPGKTTDNFGFATWVEEHKDQLVQLGPGRHFGEWYGQGIQRGYGLTERRFALFNVRKWNDENPPPGCCEVVPVIAETLFDTAAIEQEMDELRTNGSAAVPGFMDPEGIVIFHTASGSLFKKTFVGDDTGKERMAA